MFLNMNFEELGNYLNVLMIENRDKNESGLVEK